MNLILIGGCFIAFIVIVALVAWRNREFIKTKYYVFKFPEKVVKIRILFPNNLYKIFYRLIPNDNQFKLYGHVYNYGKDTLLHAQKHSKREPVKQDIQKDNSAQVPEDILIHSDEKGEFIIALGRKYYIVDSLGYRTAGSNILEITYFYNCPFPVSYDYDKKIMDLSSTEMDDFKNNDLFTKLLTMKDTQNLMMILIIIAAINLLVSIGVLGKIMGWIK